MLIEEILGLESVYDKDKDTDNSICVQVVTTPIYHEIIEKAMVGMIEVFTPEMLSTITDFHQNYCIIVNFSKIATEEKAVSKQILLNCINVILNQDPKPIPNRVKKSLLSLLFHQDQNK